MSKVYLTKEGLEKLQQELEYLESEKKVEVAEKLKEASSFGDLSENSEYEEAKNEQDRVARRISELKEQLKNVEIIEEGNEKGGRVNIGSIVEVQNISTEEKESLKIVGFTEADIFAEPKMVSNDSPIGVALLGKKSGTKVKVKAMGGDYEYRILSIK